MSPELALHGRPSVVELLEAAREFLATEVMPATTGRVQFHTRVTLRVLDTAVRQLELGAAQAAQHVERLAGLGYADDAELVEAIRAGRHDDDVAGLADVLAADVRAKLEVADPRYLLT